MPRRNRRQAPGRRLYQALPSPLRSLSQRLQTKAIRHRIERDREAARRRREQADADRDSIPRELWHYLQEGPWNE